MIDTVDILIPPFIADFSTRPVWLLLSGTSTDWASTDISTETGLTMAKVSDNPNPGLRDLRHQSELRGTASSVSVPDRGRFYSLWSKSVSVDPDNLDVGYFKSAEPAFEVHPVETAP
jgi:hypothetical protein